LNAETLPALNKLLKDQKMEAVPVAPTAPAPPACAR
jgi:hypothetical protein